MGKSCRLREWPCLGPLRLSAQPRQNADLFIPNDSSCLIQIQGLLDRKGMPVRSMHLAKVFSHSLS